MDKVYRLRFQVYCKECSFIKEEDYSDQKETDEYDPYSLHFAAEDTEGMIGTVRLIIENPLGFPFEKHCKDKLSFDFSGLDRKRIAEVSRLVISKQYRRRTGDGLYYTPDYNDSGKPADGEGARRRMKPMAFGMYREMYQESKRRGVTHWVALMEKALWVLLRMNSFVFKPIGEEIDFYGTVRPYICVLEEAEQILAQKLPNLIKYFTEGLEPQYHPRIDYPNSFANNKL